MKKTDKKKIDKEKKTGRPSIWGLFLVFAKIGMFTFGGGLAMLPMLTSELTERRDWASISELLDYYSVAQCLPGIIAINTATFVGRKHRGVLGAIAATFGVAFPSMVFMVTIAALLSSFTDSRIAQSAFAGIRICVCVLVIKAAIPLVKRSITDAACAIIFAAVLVCSIALPISPIIYVLCAGVIGILVCLLRGKRKKKEKKIDNQKNNSQEEEDK